MLSLLIYLYCVTFACLNFHRKFTKIEAANHQLASALFSVDTEPQRQSEIKSNDKDESEKKLKKGKRFHIYIITVDLMVRISLAVARHWFIV